MISFNETFHAEYLRKSVSSRLFHLGHVLLKEDPILGSFEFAKIETKQQIPNRVAEELISEKLTALTPGSDDLSHELSGGKGCAYAWTGRTFFRADTLNRRLQIGKKFLHDTLLTRDASSARHAEPDLFLTFSRFVNHDLTKPVVRVRSMDLRKLVANVHQPRSQDAAVGQFVQSVYALIQFVNNEFNVLLRNPFLAHIHVPS